MSTHICEALVVSCIDFRLQKKIQKWLSKNFKNKAYDYVGFAGASKDLKIILKQLDISVRLHKIKQVVLIHHEDCGAYGKDNSEDSHRKNAYKLKAYLEEKKTGIQVSTFMATFSGIKEL